MVEEILCADNGHFKGPVGGPDEGIKFFSDFLWVGYETHDASCEYKIAYNLHERRPRRQGKSGVSLPLSQYHKFCSRSGINRAKYVVELHRRTQRPLDPPP